MRPGLCVKRADFVHTLRILASSAAMVRMPGQLAAGVGLSTGFGFPRSLVRPAPQPAWCLTAPQAECCRRDDGRDGIALPLKSSSPLDRAAQCPVPSRAQGRGSAGRTFFGTYNFGGQRKPGPCLRDTLRKKPRRCQNHGPCLLPPDAEICLLVLGDEKARRCHRRGSCQIGKRQWYTIAVI